MFFFCRSKTITLDAFTTDPHVASLLAPDYAINFKPKWWYQVPSYEDGVSSSGIKMKNNTIRRCKGFKDYYSTSSIVIPLWDSFVLEYSDTGSRFTFANGNTLEYQAESIRGRSYLNNFHQFKLNSPWRFREKSGVNFLFTQAFYNFKDPTRFVMPPAIVNYKYQSSTEINFFVKKPKADEAKILELEAGQPLVYLTPLTEKRVVVKTHVMSQEEFKKVEVPMVFFNGLYGKLKRLGYGK